MPGHGKKLPNLGNKNASMGADGKMTIISSKMAKNQKQLSSKDLPRFKKMKYIDPKTGKDTDKKPSGLQMNYSPAKMGHSPAEMGHSPAEMESAKQKKYNLLHDNPVAKTAAGQRPWISKHFKSSFNMNHSPANMGHSPAEMEHSPAKMEHDSPAKKHCM